MMLIAYQVATATAAAASKPVCHLGSQMRKQYAATRAVCGDNFKGWQSGIQLGIGNEGFIAAVTSFIGW